MSVRGIAVTMLILCFCSVSPLLANDLSSEQARGAIEMSDPAQGPASAAPAGRSGLAVPGNPPESTAGAASAKAPDAAEENPEPAAETETDPAGADPAAAAAPSDAEPAAPADAKLLARAAETSQAEAPAAATTGDDPAAATAATATPWWRELAYYLGIASDPHPGEVADQAPARPALAPDYIIGPGDLLGISVWRDENLTRTPVVLPDGKISFPLVGETMAAGKTVAQLKRELEGKLTRYVSDAGLTVEVKQSNSMIIYIVGRVNVPGRQTMLSSTNVLQALAMAGGLNTFAQKGGIKVVRQEGAKSVMFDFNFDDVSEGRHLETNIELKRGDVIIVH